MIAEIEKNKRAKIQTVLVSERIGNHFSLFFDLERRENSWSHLFREDRSVSK